MRQNKLRVQVAYPVNKLFSFTINPFNTPLWIDHIEIEETDHWPVEIGSIYRNKSKSDNWNEYIVVNIEKNKLFELRSSEGRYHVRYTYRPLGENSSELEYFEWVDDGELQDPFTAKTLSKLKQALSKS